MTIPGRNSFYPITGYVNTNMTPDNQINSVKVHTVLVHSFKIIDVDDPVLYAASDISEWEDSEQGQWIMANAVEKPIWHRHHDPTSYAYIFNITAKLSESDYVLWLLKWK